MSQNFRFNLSACKCYRRKPKNVDYLSLDEEPKSSNQIWTKIKVYRASANEADC